MQMRSKAVVFRADGVTVHVEDILVDPPGPHQVMIKVGACGVCHSDLSVTNGTLPLPAPVILGHEGAGVVCQVGEIVAQAYGCLRKGGTAIVVGLAGPTNTTTLKTASFALEEKGIKGSYYGSTRPRHDFPRLLALYQAGKLKLDELITHRYRIDEAPQAFEDLAQGRNARGVIVFG
jgi:Zn-dependent alcohol dehydrogenase